MTPIAALNEIAESFGPEVERLAKVVLDDPRFVLWSGSSTSFNHHYGQGQLAKHTLEVIELCDLSNGYYGHPVKPSLLFLAGLYHDAGKMWDYEPLPPREGTIDYPPRAAYQEWQGTEHKNKIYHLSRSALVWNSACEKHGSFLLAGESDEVLHAILSHHGRREWKAAAIPQTKMAWILHLSDSISARVDDCDKEKPNDFKR